MYAWVKKFKGDAQSVDDTQRPDEANYVGAPEHIHAVKAAMTVFTLS